MRRVLRIDSHRAFQIAAARTVLAGGLLFLLQHQLPWPLLGPLLAVLLLGAALVPPRGLGQAALLLLLSALAGATGRWPALGPVGWALPLGLYAGLAGDALPRWQRLAVAAGATLLGLGAGLLPSAVQASEALADLPGALPQVLTGMGVGLVVGSAAILRRVRVPVDPVDRELLALLPQAAMNGEGEDEIGALVQRAFATYKEVAAVLEPHPQARAAAEDLVKKIARFGKRWREIEAEARRSGRPELLARQAELQARLQASADEQARAEYERALGGLQAQLDYLQEIDAGRERAVARLHNQVATLGRLRLAALRHRSVDAGKLGEELKAVVEDLGRAGRDLDAAAEALAEAPV